MAVVDVCVNSTWIATFVLVKAVSIGAAPAVGAIVHLGRSWLRVRVGLSVPSAR